MTPPRTSKRAGIAPLAAAAGLALFLGGIFPLPLLVRGGGAGGNLAFWAGASLLTVAPVLALATLPLPWLRGLPGRLAAWLDRPSPLAFAALIGLAFASISAALAWYAFRFAPTTPDEIAQLWHARILLHGRFSLPADPNAEFFAVNGVVATGKWYSGFPLGGPLVLALGYLLHAPWLLDPLLGGATAALLYHVARRAYGETQGRAAAVVFALAPVPLLMSASYMNHVPALFLAMLALAGVAEWERAATRVRSTLLAGGVGLALGFMAAIRPLDAVVVAVVVAVFELTAMRRGPRRWRDLWVQAAAGAVGVAPLLIANWATTGGVFHFTYDMPIALAFRPGLGAAPQVAGPAPLGAVVRVARYMSDLNAFPLGWPVPALAIVVAGLFAMRRTGRWDALFLGLLGAQLAAYSILPRDAAFLGPRFLYTAMPAMIVLVARAPFAIAERWGGFWRFGAPLAVVACLAVAWFVPMPPYGARGLVEQLRDGRGTFKVNLAAATRAAGAHHALVFVHGSFSGRLLRRLLGVGFTLSEAGDAFAHGDACSVLEAVRAAEADTTVALPQRAAAAAARIATYAPGPAPIHALDPAIHISSAQSLTPACRDELAADARYGSMPFGLGLLLEPIGPDGRLNGDVIYAADLGEHNDALRARFGDRTWYRAYTERGPDGALRAVVAPY